MLARRILRYKKTIAAIWIVLILFPNPTVILSDIYRFVNIPTQPTEHVRQIAKSLPANGTTIERYVDDHVTYAYDFQAYGAAWVIPTPNEVLKSSCGDCKSRAILLASLLEAKGIRHSVEISPVHFWVDYNGKPRTNFAEQYETAEAAIIYNGHLKAPEKTAVLLYLNTYKNVFWTSMPLMRKILLISGLLMITQYGRFQGTKRRCWKAMMLKWKLLR